MENDKFQNQPTQDNDAIAAAKEEEGRQSLKPCMRMSVIGLILSVFCGIGIFPSMVGLIWGLKLFFVDVKHGKTALILASVAVVMSVIFATLTYFIVEHLFL